jgi:glycosyltransferase involved in cell wall biosynthesis
MAFLVELSSCFFDTIKVIRMAKKEKVDLVHVHGARLPLLSGRLVSEITRCPLTVTIHEASSRATRLNRLYKGANKIIAVSQEVKASLRNCGVEEAKLVYIPNMLGEEWFDWASGQEDCGQRSSASRILFMGRLEPGKLGILRVLLEAMPRILEEFPVTQVWIGGQSGSRLLEIEKVIDKLNQESGREVVLLLGYLENPVEIIKKVDVVVGVGRIAMEAMAQGKTTIVGSSYTDSKVTGALITEDNVDKFMKYNFTGRNFEKTIDAGEMAELIIALLKNSDYRKKIGDFCRDFAEKNFRAEKVAIETESVYTNCLARARKQRGR